MVWGMSRSARRHSYSRIPWMVWGMSRSARRHSYSRIPWMVWGMSRSARRHSYSRIPWMYFQTQLQGCNRECSGVHGCTPIPKYSKLSAHFYSKAKSDVKMSKIDDKTPLDSLSRTSRLRLSVSYSRQMRCISCKHDAAHLARCHA